MAIWRKRQQMGWAALIIGTSVLLSRFAGLLRDKVISYYFGAGSESDIYFAAFVIPDFINYLLAGAYFSITLIPLLADSFAKDEEEGWRFFNSILSWIAASSILLTVTAMILAPFLAHLAAPGLDAAGSLRLARFLRIVLPAQVCFLLGSCFTSVLYLRKQFMIPALSPLIYNFMIICGGLLMRRHGMEGFCWGVLAGAFFGNFLLPFLTVRQSDSFRFRPRIRHPLLKRFFLLALPLMVGQSIVVLDEQLIRVFGSLVGPGTISWLNYARRIMLVPVGVVAQAAGVASYPFLAELIARDDQPGFDQTVNTALRNTMILLLPLSLWMMLVARPTVTLIFQQGRFAPSDTVQTAWLLTIFLAVIVAWGYQQIVGRAFYARQNTLTPAVIGTSITICSLPVYYLLSKSLHAVGVALASAFSISLYAVALSARWRHRHGGAAFAGLGRDCVRILTLAGISGLPALTAYRLLLPLQLSNPYLWALATIASTGSLFAVFFLGLGFRFTPALMQPINEKLFFWTRRFPSTTP